MSKKVSVVTMTFNCVDFIPSYIEAFRALDQSLFDWIVVDAGSTDGTTQLLNANSTLFKTLISEPDSGFYYGLNKALRYVETPFYVVFGSDDRPSENFEAVLRASVIDWSAMLVMGNVRLMPSNAVKCPGPRWLHRFVVGRAVSHHSVGTMINMEAHRRFGFYDVNYRLVADSLFLKRVLKSGEKIQYVPEVFGEFLLGGMSSKQQLRSIIETLMYQLSEGSNVFVQVALASLRIYKLAFLSWLKGSKLG